MWFYCCYASLQLLFGCLGNSHGCFDENILEGEVMCTVDRLIDRELKLGPTQLSCVVHTVKYMYPCFLQL